MALTQVNSSGVKDDSIVNADIKSDAAIAFSKLASIPTVLTGSTNNTICTVTGHNSINGEAKLTFDGDTLKFTHDAVTNFDSNAQDFLVIENGDSDTYINIGTETNRDSGLLFSDDTRARGWYGYNHTGDYAYIGTAGSERLRIISDGKVVIGGNYTNSANFGRQVLIDGTLGVNNDSGTVGIGFSKGHTLTYGYIGTGDWAVNGAAADDFGITSGSTGDLLLGTAGTERLRVLAGGGLTFNGDTAAGNAIDDYEEGTWTPAFIPSGGSYTSIGYASQDGYYVKVGRVVNIWFRINVSSLNTSGGSGYIKLSGVPFTSASGSGIDGATLNFNYYTAHLSNMGNQVPSGYIQNGNTTYVIGKNGGNQWNNIAYDDISSGLNIYAHSSYYANA